MALLIVATVMAAAGTALHFATTTHVAGVGSSQASTQRSLSRVSLPLFFEPNQGQTDPQVRFLARGAGYTLFLTANEAVLELHQSSPSPFGSGQAKVSRQLSAVGPPPSAIRPQPSTDSVIRMRLDGANSSARVSGVEPLRGKSNYFIGSDPAKWHRNIPQFARVNYAAVYPGVDLVYYGNQGQIEYDFRVAPGADPSQIVLNFDGASARLDSGNLVLSTGQGDLLFHAPQIYQQEGNTRKTIAGSFRQLAGNKIGFALGAYDHSRELVIDPTLSYSTYLGGGGESNAQVAVDAGLNIYVAGSTTSANFPLVNPLSCCVKLNGTQNIFIAKLNPFATGADQLLFATYLGGEGTDTATGVAVDSGGSIYVAGFTTSTIFPTTPNAFQQTAAVAGTHGFLSKLSLLLGNYSLSYSTYLAGNLANGGTGDMVTGLAIDSKQDAFVTGTTTSTDTPSQSVGFPANLNGYQQQSNAASQFFASKINTAGSGFGSMLYSTYFGGSTVPPGFQLATVGGGIAVDTGGNVYFTGGMNFIGGQPPLFPLLNAQQTCLNQAGQTSDCANSSGNLDAFVVKINPNIVGSAGLVFSTFLGGDDNDVGLAIAVDSSSNPYITGETFTPSNVPPPDGWNQPSNLAAFQGTYGGNGDAFIVKLGPLSSGIYPIGYFTYIGGTGEDVGRAIAVDAVQGAHVTGSTNSTDLSVYDELDKQPNGYGGGGDAFVALILTTFSGHPLPPPAPFNGDYLTYLGGSDFDQGTGIAIDTNDATYVAGETKSGNFPTQNPYQGQLIGTQNAFVSKISALSSFAYVTGSPTVIPNPADMGLSVTFTFEFVNNGPEAANNVVFNGALTGTSQGQGFTFTSANASPGGSCPAPVGGVLACQIGTVAAGSDATVTVVLVPTCTSPSTCATSLTVTPSLSANGGGFTQFAAASVPVDDFSITATQTSQTVVAGNSTSFAFTLAPVPSNQTYTGSVSMSFSGLPPATTGTWTTNPVTISGNTSTTLNIATTARPVNTGRLQHGGPLYATWLPVAGLSLLGLGFGAGWRRRRWLAGVVLGLIAGIILLQPACGSSSSTAPPGGGTPAGTYQLTITATSGTDVHTAPVTLIVQ